MTRDTTLTRLHELITGAASEARHRGFVIWFHAPAAVGDRAVCEPGRTDVPEDFAIDVRQVSAIPRGVLFGGRYPIAADPFERECVFTQIAWQVVNSAAQFNRRCVVYLDVRQDEVHVGLACP